MDKFVKVITIDDFSGGLNSFEPFPVLKQNQCASGTVNVWAPQQALTKTPGTTLFQQVGGLSTDDQNMVANATAMSLFYIDPSITTAFQIYFLGNLVSPTNGAGLYCADGLSASALGYTTGTVSISGGSLISATGNGTSWLSQVKAGDLFGASASAANLNRTWTAVKSVEDDTHLTLTAAYVGAVPTGTSYKIHQVMTAGSARGPLTAATLNGMIAFSNVLNNLMTYDSTGTLRRSSAPQVQYLATHKNYMFGLRTSTAESRLYWSAVRDPTSWPANNFADVDKFNGKGTGLYSFGNELLVFKTRSMFRVVGDVFDPANPTFSITPIEVPDDFVYNDNGNLASTTVLYYGQPRSVLVLMARGSLYSYTQGSPGIQKISQLFQPDLSNFFFNSTQAADSTATFDAHAVSFNNNVFFSGITFAAGNDKRVGILDKNGGFWMTNTTAGQGTNTAMAMGACHWGVFTETTARPSLLYADTQNGFGTISKWNVLGPTYTTNFIQIANPSQTAPINSAWFSKEFNIEYGHFRKVIVYFAKQSSGTFTLGWSIDQGTYVQQSVDMTTGRGQIIRKVLDVNQKGTSIQLQIINTAASQTFSIYAIKIYYEPIDENRQP